MRARWVFCICTEKLCWCDNMVFMPEDDKDFFEINFESDDYVHPCGPCERSEHKLYPPTPQDFIRVADRIARG